MYIKDWKNPKFLGTVVVAALSLSGTAVPSGAENMAVIPGEQASRSAFVTNKGINWYRDLSAAEAEAKKSGRLVFWVHMLGTMDGAT